MKAAIFSESHHDDVAVHIWVEAILGQRVELLYPPQLEARSGWTSFLRLIPTVVRHLHYRTDVEGLIIVADSDDSAIHSPSHKGLDREDCRYCRLSQRVEETKAKLRPKRGKPPLKTAIGIAVPAIEAWFRCGLAPHVNEAAYVQKLQASDLIQVRNQLKRDVYGSDRPSSKTQREQAVEQARRLARNLDVLEQQFPNGFGLFAEALRQW